MKKALLASALAVAVVGHLPAQAESQGVSSEIRVGMIDVQGRVLSFEDKNTAIYYKEFAPEGKSPATWQTESGFDHGDMMASAFVRQMRKIDASKKVMLFSANIFYENSASNATHSMAMRNMSSQRTISMNQEGMSKALDWFKENGVKVVLTAFNGQDNAQMKAFMAKANANGMIVFASAGNKVGGSSYPAAYPETISVAADNKDLVFRKDKSISTWVNFTMDGGVPLTKSGRSIDEGSSFATAKAAAFGAYYSSLNPSVSVDQLRSALKDVASPMSYEVNEEPVVSMRFDDVESARKITDVAMRQGKDSEETARNLSGISGERVVQNASLGFSASTLQR